MSPEQIWTNAVNARETDDFSAPRQLLFKSRFNQLSAYRVV